MSPKSIIIVLRLGVDTIDGIKSLHLRKQLILCTLFLVTNPLASAKSDWVDEDLTSADNKSPVRSVSPASVGRRPAEDNDAATGGKHNLSPSPVHLDSSTPLKGQVSDCRNFGSNLSASLMNAARIQTILNNAPILPPAKGSAISSGILKKWLWTANPQLASRLAEIKKDEIVELKGAWDDSGHVLRSFGLPYTRIGALDLAHTSLTRTRVIIVNCGALLDLPGQRAVNKFVSDGGYLLTTDWALDSCLRQCFPNYVAANGGFTESQVVDAVAVGQDKSFYKDTVSPAYWKLEEKSQLVQILNPEAIDVLVLSRQLMRQDPSQKGILAFSFTFGQGKVLHLVGHFDSNSAGAFNNMLSDPSPNIIVSLRQAIATNFIASAFNNAPASENQTIDKFLDK